MDKVFLLVLQVQGHMRSRDNVAPTSDNYIHSIIQEEVEAAAVAKLKVIGASSRNALLGLLMKIC